jgi:hypothetical protein
VVEEETDEEEDTVEEEDEGDEEKQKGGRSNKDSCSECTQPSIRLLSRPRSDTREGSKGDSGKGDNRERVNTKNGSAKGSGGHAGKNDSPREGRGHKDRQNKRLVGGGDGVPQPGDGSEEAVARAVQGAEGAPDLQLLQDRIGELSVSVLPPSCSDEMRTDTDIQFIKHLTVLVNQYSDNITKQNDRNNYSHTHELLLAEHRKLKAELEDENTRKWANVIRDACLLGPMWGPEVVGLPVECRPRIQNLI